MPIVLVACRAKVIPVKIGKAKRGRLWSIFDDLWSKSSAILAESVSIVGGFYRGLKRGYRKCAGSNRTTKNAKGTKKRDVFCHEFSRMGAKKMKRTANADGADLAD